MAILSLYNVINKRLPGWQDPPTRDAIQAAVQSLMDDGTYDKLLKKWNLESFKIDEPTINGTK